MGKSSIASLVRPIGHVEGGQHERISNAAAGVESHSHGGRFVQLNLAAAEFKKRGCSMKSMTLLLARLGTGFLLVIWGLTKTLMPSVSIHVSNAHYAGMLSMTALQRPLGVLEVALGLLVVVGLWRKYVLPIQALVLGVTLIALWKYILDPFGLYLLSEQTRQILFFPSLAVFAAALLQLAFSEADTVNLDRVFRRE
jgi:putative oxidoreductase